MTPRRTLRALALDLRLRLAQAVLDHWRAGPASGWADAGAAEGPDLSERLDRTVVEALTGVLWELAGAPAALPPLPGAPAALPALPGAAGDLLAALWRRWAGRGLPRGLAAELGALYEHWLARPLVVAGGQVRAGRSDRRRRGAGIYYTPRTLVRYILNRIPEPPGSVLDLSAGAGAFLLAARARWPAAALYGVDLDPQAVALGRLALALAAGRQPGAGQARLLCGDALDLPPDAGLPAAVDLVVGNPPYYSCQSLPRSVQARLRERYPEVWSAQNDILYYFLVEGVRRLRPGGRLAMVVARYFLHAAHARRLREWLLHHAAVEHILDLQNVQLFPGADVLTVVLVLRREPDPARRAAQRVQVVTVHGRWADGGRLLRHVEAVLDGRAGAAGRADAGRVEVGELPQAALGPGPWDLTPPSARRVMVRVAGGTVPLGRLCRIGQGMKSGANGIFVVTAEEAAAWGLEPELLRPYVKTRDIHPFRCHWRRLYLLDVRSETPIHRYPAAAAYLAAHRAVLERRYQVRAGHTPWYALSIPQNAALFDSARHKLITPAYARTNRFALDLGEGYYTLTDTYILVPEPGVDPEFLAGVLNSRVGNFLYRQVAKLKRDGYYEYVSGSLARFPVPAAPAAGLRERVVQAVRALRDRVEPEAGWAQELDAAVGALYGLDPAGLE